uniref:Uncharacterized protein n=1 Tax=Romanomermis culicivorax TaxID=13658 RepID=A0A915IW17_ROMCU
MTFSNEETVHGKYLKFREHFCLENRNKANFSANVAGTEIAGAQTEAPKFGSRTEKRRRRSWETLHLGTNIRLVVYFILETAYLRDNRL